MIMLLMLRSRGRRCGCLLFEIVLCQLDKILQLCFQGEQLAVVGTVLERLIDLNKLLEV